MSKPIKHVRVGVIKVSQLGNLVELLSRYKGHSCASHVVGRAIRRIHNQPLTGPVNY